MQSHEAEYWRELSVELRGQGRLEEAVTACRRALECSPDDARALSDLAHALRWQGKLGEAREALTQAIQAAPGLANAWCNLGAVLVVQSETAPGVEAYRKALELQEFLYPDFISFHPGYAGCPRIELRSRAMLRLLPATMSKRSKITAGKEITNEHNRI